MERVATFNRVGKEFTNGMNLVDGIPEEMAFSVRKEPMGFVLPNGNFHRVKGYSTIVRDTDNFAFGAVSDKYAPVDNVTALGCLQYIDGLEIKRYGSSDKSGIQYIIGALPDTTILGDTFTPYLVFRNSFNGKFPIQVAISPLRIVCQNQLTIAFREANNTFNIKHTVKAVERLEEAQKILIGVHDFMTELNKVAEQYAMQKISRQQELDIIRAMFPINENMTNRQKATITDNIANFERALNEDDNLNFRGTAWGMIQAFTDAHTHKIMQRETATMYENNFVAVTFDARPLMAMIAMMNSIAA